MSGMIDVSCAMAEEKKRQSHLRHREFFILFCGSKKINLFLCVEGCVKKLAFRMFNQKNLV